MTSDNVVRERKLQLAIRHGNGGKSDIGGYVTVITYSTTCFVLKSAFRKQPYAFGTTMAETDTVKEGRSGESQTNSVFLSDIL